MTTLRELGIGLIKYTALIIFFIVISVFIYYTLVYDSKDYNKNLTFNIDDHSSFRVRLYTAVDQFDDE